jgi:hypothetical protein
VKLFAIYIGGELDGANIELHDMRFVVAPSIGETYDELRRQWWGKPKGLHIDCWAEISHIDGYDVTLRQELYLGAERLFYVNLGGYETDQFLEAHRNTFVIAETVAQAKYRALKRVKDWREPHRDDLYEAEQAFALTDVARDEHLYVHLERVETTRELSFICDYTPIR